MRKVLYFIFAILGLAYIAIMALYGVNLMHPFMTEFFTSDIFNFVSKWGMLVIIGGFCFTNFFGKTLKLIFFFLLIAAVTLFVLAHGSPEIFA